MPTCPSCQAEVPARSRFCGECGAVVEGPVPGVKPAGGPVSPSAAATVVHAPPAGFGSDALFTPGSMIASRYRIVACLGKGGMGEVYRADDLTLGQPVALKFLPREVAESPRWLERFRNEVRVARQVAHPAVCRVHDLGEVPAPDAPGAAPLQFITMEYIDGEDLGSLLRRIGRLPKDKAVQVARQLCAGLAAAHGAGVLHRDLKPANVMIDGRGNAKITDFGIAGLAGQIQGSDVRSGTPAYMSPEQLAAREVTVRSDLYALGLVLYELFTGRRAFQAETMTSATASRVAGELSRPSSLVEDMDPTVERVIMRCLAEDPAQRPPSALAVAAALPGGDPLRAALEAGETPSPELVAAAGPDGRLGLRPVIVLVVGTLAMIAWLFGVAPRTDLVAYLPLPRSPEVLADRAREAIEALGYAESLKDSADSLTLPRQGYLRHVLESSKAADRWEALRAGRPSVLRFWYRASPEPMVPLAYDRVVTPSDPPMTVPGMVLVELDSLGHLHAFRAVPPSESPARAEAPGTKVAVVPPEKTRMSPKGRPAAAGEGGAADWRDVFELAGLEFEKFAGTEPVRTPPGFADERVAWLGTFPEHPEVALRVEAASLRGRAVYFRLLAPWELQPAAPGEAIGPRRLLQAGAIALQCAVIFGVLFSVWVARRNHLSGRGDRAGAAKLAVGFCVITVLNWALGTHLEPNLTAQWSAFLRGVGRALLLGGLAWAFYMALEPFVRRRNPELIVSWTRLLAGRWRDTLVGRDALLGVGLGAFFAGVARAVPLLHEQIFGVLPQPQPCDVHMLGGVLGTMQAVLESVTQAAINGLCVFLTLIAVCALLQRVRIGPLVFGVVATFLLLDSTTPGTSAWINLGFAVGAAALSTLVLARFGLLVFFVGLVVTMLLSSTPMTTELGSWHARGTAIVLALIATLLGWSIAAATGQLASRAPRGAGPAV